MSRFPPETPFINPCFRQMGARRNMFARLKTALTLQSLGVPNRSEDEQISASPKPFSGFDLNKHPINQQLQCKIFKLSLEIRLLIYEQLIKAWAPGDGYHIVDACEVRYMSKDDKGLTFVPCDCPSTATINHQLGSERSDFHSWNLHDIRRLEWRETCKSPATYGWATNRLAILLSCRRM